MFHYGSSIKGRRENNQDSFLIFGPNEQTTFLAIADGIGGAVGGEIASKLVIDNAKEFITESFNNKIDPSNLKGILNQVYRESQKAIHDRIAKEVKLYGMGTTLTCVLIHNDDYVWANIGDSRVYQFANGRFNQITKDHSFIEGIKMSENERYTNKIVKNYNHILTRSISGGEDEPDIYPSDVPYKKLNCGEGLLLCSDGLIVEINVNENNLFNELLMRSNNIKEFVENLIYDAYLKGSDDNITCLAWWKNWNNVKNKNMLTKK